MGSNRRPEPLPGLVLYSLLFLISRHGGIQDAGALGK